MRDILPYNWMAPRRQPSSRQYRWRCRGARSLYLNKNERMKKVVKSIQKYL